MDGIEKKGVRPDGYKATDEEVAQQEEMIERKGLSDVVVAENATTSSTCKESLQVGNMAKMREALKYLRDASREFCHLILNSKYNAIFDKYKHPEVAKISDAIANAGIVLAEPPRNCDIMPLETARKVWFAKEIIPRLHGDLPLGKEVPFQEWFVSQQAKGETK